MVKSQTKLTEKGRKTDRFYKKTTTTKNIQVLFFRPWVGQNEMELIDCIERDRSRERVGWEPQSDGAHPAPIPADILAKAQNFWQEARTSLTAPNNW